MFGWFRERPNPEIGNEMAVGEKIVSGVSDFGGENKRLRKYRSIFFKNLG